MATEDDVRRIALELPETIEKPWYGTPGFRVKDKGFLRIRSDAEGGLVVFVEDLGEKEALLASDPDKFFTTPHYDGYADRAGQPGRHRRRRAHRVDRRLVAPESPRRVLKQHGDHLPGTTR